MIRLITPRVSDVIDPPALLSPLPAGIGGHTGLPQEWLTTQEAADNLRVPVGTLRNWISSGKIPYRKIGRSHRYKVDEFRDLLNRNRRGGSHDY